MAGMRAVVFHQFGGPLAVEEVPDPACPEDGVVVEVDATGVCRSDWHGWMGHDADIRTLPHVPGHELAGTVAAVGPDVRRWKVGDRVTVPFVLGCGACEPCGNGDQQICDRQLQPGFTQWGSFAELVPIPRADLNLVRLPDGMTAITAASLGCRFATSFRAVAQQGRVAAGEWVAVHGCGGVGLSAVMIAAATGARVIAIDVSPEALVAATAAGAHAVIDGSGRTPPEMSSAVRDLTGGGAHLSIDAIGSVATCTASVEGLRKRGRHVQVGLMVGDAARPGVPMDLVIGRELELLGSHGMAAHAYPEMLGLVAAGRLAPERLIATRIGLGEVPAALVAMSDGSPTAITVIRPG